MARRLLFFIVLAGLGVLLVSSASTYRPVAKCQRPNVQHNIVERFWVGQR